MDIYVTILWSRFRTVQDRSRSNVMGSILWVTPHLLRLYLDDKFSENATCRAFNAFVWQTDWLTDSLTNWFRNLWNAAKRQWWTDYLGDEKSLRKEHNLTDLLHVRNDDNNRTKQRLDGLRQLCTTSIAWVHSDEDANTWIQHDLLTFELSHIKHTHHHRS